MGKDHRYSPERQKNLPLWIHQRLTLSLRAAVNSTWWRPLRRPRRAGCFLLSWRGGATVRHRGAQHSAQSLIPPRLLEKCEHCCHTWLLSPCSFLFTAISQRKTVEFCRMSSILSRTLLHVVIIETVCEM